MLPRPLSRAGIAAEASRAHTNHFDSAYIPCLQVEHLAPRHSLYGASSWPCQRCPLWPALQHRQMPQPSRQQQPHEGAPCSGGAFSHSAGTARAQRQVLR